MKKEANTGKKMWKNGGKRQNCEESGKNRVGGEEKKTEGKQEEKKQRKRKRKKEK